MELDNRRLISMYQRMYTIPGVRPDSRRRVPRRHHTQARSTLMSARKPSPSVSASPSVKTT